jgi:hypothetical protein
MIEPGTAAFRGGRFICRTSHAWKFARRTAGPDKKVNPPSVEVLTGH